MKALVFLLGFMMVTLLMGKRMQKLNFKTYTLVILIAFLQVIAAFIAMFTVEAPEIMYY